MDKINHLFFQEWAELPEFHERISQASDQIKKVCEQYKPILLYSGGKDSLVMLHLAMQIDPEMPVYHFNEGFDGERGTWRFPPAVEAEAIQNARAVGAKNLYVRGGGSAGPSARRFFGNLYEVMRQTHTDIEMMGHRAAESKGRKRRISAHILHEGHRTIFAPLKDLRTEDIWAYILSNNLCYASNYDRYGPLVGWMNARFTSMFSYAMTSKGGGVIIDGMLFPEYKY
jgi:3'-phosphoadenosine 5'-phosphosulfate sulfotransferase (PAPS reductase)/FAD synthetase